MTDAAITADTVDDGVLHPRLSYRLGDTWIAPEPWAIVVYGSPVDLGDGTWTVRAQVRDRDGDLLMEWSTTNGRVQLGYADVDLGGGTLVRTSTILLRHGPDAGGERPFTERFDVEITQRLSGSGPILQRHTPVDGICEAIADVTR